MIRQQHSGGAATRRCIDSWEVMVPASEIQFNGARADKTMHHLVFNQHCSGNNMKVYHLAVLIESERKSAVHDVDTTFEDTAGEEAKLEKKGREKYDRGSNPEGWIRSGKHSCEKGMGGRKDEISKGLRVIRTLTTLNSTNGCLPL